MIRITRHIIRAYLLLLAISLVTCFVSCKGEKTLPTMRSAYYWSTTWLMDSSKTNFIREHRIKRLYVRYFDVVEDEEGEAVPNATILFQSPIPKGIEIIPVIYIINDCLKSKGFHEEKGNDSENGNNKEHSINEGNGNNEKFIQQLTEKILKRIIQMNEANDIKNVKEIQIDCDWTVSTQDTYFDFLKILREKAQAQQMKLSATIRLHQLSMTPPPVDRGILMMYNTGDAKQLKCQKPILDMKDVAPYIQHLGSYPLPLSAAYPLFSWRILFRGDKFVGIMHTDDELPILPGDSIVVRKPEMTDITEAVKSINRQNRDINNEVILFDLSSQNIKRFNSKDYERIYQH